MRRGRAVYEMKNAAGRRGDGEAKPRAGAGFGRAAHHEPASRPDQQGRPGPRPRHAGRGGLGNCEGPGPLHAFFVRIRAKRGHQVAAVALARKLTVLAPADPRGGLSLGATDADRSKGPGHGTHGRDAREERKPSGHGLCPRQQGTSGSGAPGRRAGRENLRAVRRALEDATAKQPDARAPQSGKARTGGPAALAADAPLFATRSPAQPKDSIEFTIPLVHHIRRVNYPPNFGSEDEERDDLLPRLAPSLGDRRILPAPGRVEGLEHIPARSAVSAT